MMNERPTDSDGVNVLARGNTCLWPKVIFGLGALILTTAVAKSIDDLVSGGGFLEAVLDLTLISSPGIVMMYTGRWLPSSTIKSEFYPRIVTWMVGGVLIMGFVLGLRVIHPGVNVQFTFGTQAVLLSIGSIAGLGIGVNEAQSFTHAKALEEQNKRLKQTERQLEEAVAQLEASNEQLEQFAYAASHDLQEPLRMVTNYLQLAESRFGDELDEDCKEFIGFAVDGAERMREMIDGLLEYSRVETQDDPFGTVDLDGVLDDVLKDLQLRIEETNTKLERDPLPTVDGNERQLYQLFQNLLGNAIEYSGDESPKIHISAGHDEAGWTISVRDEGIGIGSEDTDRIFGIFQRLHTIDEHAGSGIGLALCERIIDRHGGDIWVDSTIGKGSTFSFTIPSIDRTPVH